MAGTAFGPQSPNYVTTLPTTDPNVSGVAVDTFFKDCTSANLAVPDGTVLTAGWLNTIVGNLRAAVRDRAVTMLDGDLTLLSKALTATSVVSTAAAIPPVYATVKVGDLWFDTSDNSTNVYLSDGTTSAWFQIA